MKVYSMNISDINPGDEKWYKYLSPRRADKVNKIKSRQKKAQSIGAELLLRRAVSDITQNLQNVVWDTDNNGKLYLPDYPSVYVNLSHSGDYAVCAACDSPVGIDIQYMREYNKNLSKRFFTAAEEKYISESADTADAFYSVWTRKESFLKAVGKGITVPLNSFSVLEDKIIYEGEIYKFKEYRVSDSRYKLFVCFASSPE